MEIENRNYKQVENYKEKGGSQEENEERYNDERENEERQIDEESENIYQAGEEAERNSVIEGENENLVPKKKDDHNIYLIVFGLLCLIFLFVIVFDDNSKSSFFSIFSSTRSSKRRHKRDNFEEKNHKNDEEIEEYQENNQEELRNREEEIQESEEEEREYEEDEEEDDYYDEENEYYDEGKEAFRETDYKYNIEPEKDSEIALGLENKYKRNIQEIHDEWKELGYGGGIKKPVITERSPGYIIDSNDNLVPFEKEPEELTSKEIANVVKQGRPYYNEWKGKRGIFREGSTVYPEYKGNETLNNNIEHNNTVEDYIKNNFKSKSSEENVAVIKESIEQGFERNPNELNKKNNLRANRNADEERENPTYTNIFRNKISQNQRYLNKMTKNRAMNADTSEEKYFNLVKDETSNPEEYQEYQENVSEDTVGSEEESNDTFN